MAISFIDGESANSNVVSISGIASGDLILVFAYNGSSATTPTLAAGYSSVRTNSTGSNAARLGVKTAVGTETDSGTWTNATQVVCLVYRGASGVGNNNGQAATSAGLNYQTVTLTVGDGSSWIAGFGGARSATAGMDGNMSVLNTNRTHQTTCNGLDTNTGVTSFTTHLLTVTGSGNWITATVEIVAAVSQDTFTEALQYQVLG